MNRKDLKFPFKWEERKPLILDKIFFVPKLYDPIPRLFPGWQDERVFGRHAPTYIEYCTGNGAWIIERAKNYPECNWVAVEKSLIAFRKFGLK